MKLEKRSRKDSILATEKQTQLVERTQQDIARMELNRNFWYNFENFKGENFFHETLGGHSRLQHGCFQNSDPSWAEGFWRSARGSEI